MRRILAAAAMFMLSSPLFAADSPNVQKGFAADKTYQFNDIDHINTFNGNLEVVIPIGPRYVVGGSLSYQFSLAYSGNNWNYEGQLVLVPDGNGGSVERPFEYAYPTDIANAGIGWWFGFGRIGNDPADGEFFYQSPDGAKHRFRSRLHTQNSNEGVTGVPAQPDGTSFSGDGTYIRRHDHLLTD